MRHLFGGEPNIHVCHHQEAHVAAAFYGSTYQDATAITLDAYGDNSSGAIYKCCRDKGLEKIEMFEKEESIGVPYTAMTYHLGFEDGDEYKVMGLAPYGEEKNELVMEIKAIKSEMVTRKSPKILSPFDYPSDSEKIFELTGIKQRAVCEDLTKNHSDLAHNLQMWANRTIYEVIKKSIKLGSSRNIVYAGGVALNCSTNKYIGERLMDKNFYVSPVASDRGLSYGCAAIGSKLLGYVPEPLGVPYYGKSYSDEEIKKELDSNGIEYIYSENYIEDITSDLSSGKIIGWFQGRSEAGARALGNRSIICSAGSSEMRDKLNVRIKYREKFRPFAPIVTEEDASKYWKINHCISYDCMNHAVEALDTAKKYAPAAVHVDGSSRLQTISSTSNPILHSLLKTYESKCGSPILLNTSFNLKGQPIVESPRDALMTFYGCGLDTLIMGKYIIRKHNSTN